MLKTRQILYPREKHHFCFRCQSVRCNAMRTRTVLTLILFQRFAIVEFLAEDGNVATVPLVWVKNKRIGTVSGKKAVLGKSYWPPKSMQRKANTLAKTQVQPERSTWIMHDVELLKYCGNDEPLFYLHTLFCTNSRVYSQDPTEYTTPEYLAPHVNVCTQMSTRS